MATELDKARQRIQNRKKREESVEEKEREREFQLTQPDWEKVQRRKLDTCRKYESKVLPTLVDVVAARWKQSVPNRLFTIFEAAAREVEKGENKNG